MSCPNATSPINISLNLSNTCDLKCEYSFTYQAINLVGSNKGEYMSFRPDAQTTPPVTYNADKYDVSEMRIYYPSLHTFGGVKAAAEVVLIHTNVTGNGSLLVCIPIKTGTTVDNATTILDTLISQISKFAPNAGGNAGTINLPAFTFGDIVPFKPFYSYTGTLPYTPCDGEYNFIVYPLDNAIPMTTAALKMFSSIISENTYEVKKCASTLYYNKNGPTKEVGDDIYIDCQPTGSDGEILIADTSTTSGLFNSSSINLVLGSSAISIIIGILVMIFLIAFVGMIIKKMGGTNGGGGGGGGADAGTD